MERAGEKDLIAGAGRGVMGSPSGACMFKLRANQQSAVLTAIRREQEQSVRRVNLIRLCGASGLLALYVVLDLVLQQAEWGGGAVPMVAAYWAAAGGLVLLGRRLKLMAFAAGLAIPVLDLSFIFGLLYSTMGLSLIHI